MALHSSILHDHEAFPGPSVVPGKREPTPIGVFDSGLGGLTVLAACSERLPEQDFIYFGDNRNTPYGSRSAQEVLQLTRSGVEVLFARGCRLVILACNTAAALALRKLQSEWLDPTRHRLLGVFVPVIELLTRRDWGDVSPPTHTGLQSVALFGTPTMIGSGAFERELHFRARDVEVVAQPCPGLVEAIETGETLQARDLVAQHVEELLARLRRPQAAVLGCTHYPLVRSEFAAALPPETEIVCQPSVTAGRLEAYLERHQEFAGGKGRVAYLTSGDPDRVSRQAARFIRCEHRFEPL